MEEVDADLEKAVDRSDLMNFNPRESPEVEVKRVKLEDLPDIPCCETVFTRPPTLLPSVEENNCPNILLDMGSYEAEQAPLLQMLNEVDSESHTEHFYESDAYESDHEEQQLDSSDTERDISDNEIYETTFTNSVSYIGKDGTTRWKKHKPEPKNVKTRQENIIKRLPGTTTATRGLKEPIEIWEYFITDQMINIIVDGTNDYIQSVGNKIKPSSLHSYVKNDRYSLRKILLGLNDNDISKVSTGDPQKCTEIMSKKIYDEFRIPHGYHFDTNYINKDKNSGSFTGHCECGSTLKCMILPRLEQEEIVKIECVATKANSEKFGNCHNRQYRGKTRKEVVSILEKQSVEAYRAQIAAQNMQEGDSYEPPHLYSGDVLRTARCPEGRNVVRDIGSDPVIVHFWSPHQIRIFNNMNKIENARLCIDATGKHAKYVLHMNNEKSHHIFLYIGVLYCSAGQFSVMFSESQDTVTISTWLRRWIQSGAQFPKEVVFDSSRALLNACRIYQKRGKTLLNYRNKEAIPNSIELVDCACNVASLAIFLFKSTPSFQKIATCSGGCPPRIKSLPSITFTDREMKDPLGQIIKNHVVLPDVQCQNENCEMMEQNQIHTLSDIVLIAVDMDDSIDLASIPKKFACPKTEEMYDLLGFVDNQGQNMKTRRSTSIGHYTAVCKRK
ncbi:hypothetical protein JTB14_010021 [Gonioctena quinquepunctata]|nr:hypothetical protein JTB14_010021 [Gonioctena quinquepunctata]